MTAHWCAAHCEVVLITDDDGVIEDWDLAPQKRGEAYH